MRTEPCRRCGDKVYDKPHPRYYCPGCHEVACGKERMGEVVIHPHYRRDEKGNVKLDRLCRGGVVDPRKDRAP